jgi:hypothetical protein
VRVVTCPRRVPAGSLPKRLPHSIDVRVSEAQHAITQVIQRPVSRFVALAMSIESVLHAVYFHDQPPSPTFEVYDVVRDRRLAAEMKIKFPQFA